MVEEWLSFLSTLNEAVQKDTDDDDDARSGIEDEEEGLEEAEG